jgi:hypothetical protein
VSLLDNVAAVEDWYQAQTGKIPPSSRVLNIMLAIDKEVGTPIPIEIGGKMSYLDYGKILDRSYTLKVVSDPLWTSRRNRTESEKRGVLIGKGKDGTRAEFWYLVPKGKEGDK